jgi:radical SAM protein with 4Fe4S-binding SPASM domain
MHWPVLVQAVEYAKALDSRIRLSMSSNGVWSNTQRQFICHHFDEVSLSMDGTQLVQDYQRPRPDGSGSFHAVMESIMAMDEAHVDYGVRITMLPETVQHLPKVVCFLCEKTLAAAIQVEPTFTRTRGCYADINEEFADVFADRFMQAWQAGQAAGRHVYYSAARPWVVAPAFCLAPLNAMVVTADGRLVTCFEVFSEHSPVAKSFTVGRVREGRVDYDLGALRAFVDTQQQRRAECRDCFCYWHCCGDCATRRPETRARTSGRCRATQRITLNLLLAYMEEGGGVWQGLRDTSESRYLNPNTRSSP